MPVKQALHGVFKHCGLRPCLGPGEGIGPGSFYMADDRQRPAVRVAEHFGGQFGQERIGCDGAALLEGLFGKLIVQRGARAIAGEEKGDHPQQAGVWLQVIPGKIKILRDFAAPALCAGPILAQECTLVGDLPRAVYGEAHPMAASEEQSRGLVSTQQALQLALGRLLCQVGTQLPIGEFGLEFVVDRFDQVL